MIRKLLTLTLALLLLCSLCLPAAAASDEALSAADTLNALGLFGGVGSNPDGSINYELDRAPTRHEAVTMLVRLLGKESEAKAGTWSTPFTDVASWAQPYVGYAYANGLTTGTGTTTFGGEDTVTAAQYLTFVLRALGYVSGTDFQWDKAWELTDELGITGGQYDADNDKSFLRADVAIVSRSAMDAAPKNSEIQLLDQLVAEGAVSQTAAEVSGLRPDAYMLFAQQLLDAADDETVTMPLVDKTFVSSEAAEFVGKNDVYCANRFTEDAGDPQQYAKALSYALKLYISECMDGNYNNHTPVDTRITAFHTDSALLLTDEKGCIVGYGFYDVDGPEEVTLYTCKVDSREFVDQAVIDLNASIDALPHIDCEMTMENDQFSVVFSALPSDAVKLVTFWGLYYNDPPTEAQLRSRIEDYFNRLLGNTNVGDPVQSPYTSKNPWPNDHGYAYCVVIFVDAAGYPIACSTAELKI